MKLAEILPLFARFGFSERDVRLALQTGHNGLEGLKLCLELKWNEMNQVLGTDRLKELKPDYDRLQGLKLVAVRTEEDVQRERAERVENAARNMDSALRQHKRNVLDTFLASLERERDRTTSPAARGKIADYIDWLTKKPG